MREVWCVIPHKFSDDIKMCFLQLMVIDAKLCRLLEFCDAVL